jgi:beta-1,4-mannosyl-glycoprotein beta-1,4-N-acetylglucosaminyltransferase
MAVYDAFMFFNEFDMLSVRLAEHDPFVDFFVLIQADRTFSGVSKPLHFLKADPRFAKYAHKVIVVDVPLRANPESAWDNEFLQRQAAFSAVAYQPDDILYLSDVDEIISRHCWDYLLNRMQNENMIGVWLRMFYYFVNLELIDHPWALAKLIKAKVFLDADVSGNEIRCSPAAITTPFPCGWHFSYFGGANQIINKLKSFSHQEFVNNDIIDEKNIKYKIQNSLDVLNRDGGEKNRILGYVPFNEKNYWPKKINFLKKLFKL